MAKVEKIDKAPQAGELTNALQRLEPGGSLHSLAPEEILESYPGAGVLVDQRGRVVASNPLGAGLANALVQGSDLPLRAALSNALADNHATALEIKIEDADGSPSAVAVSVLPVTGPDGAARVLVLGRETTVERGIISALVESRKLFRDLVMCSSDFAWETSDQGEFGFVSPRGALGYSVAELNGRLAYEMLDRAVPEPEIFPFDTRVQLEDAEVNLLGADGASACLLVSAMPVFGTDGEYKGARGVCRDVTEARARDAELARIQGRVELLGGIVESIRSEVIPSAILAAAAHATATALSARHCWIFRMGKSGFSLAADDDGDAGPPPSEALKLAAEALGNAPDGAAVRLASGDLVIVAAVARYLDRVNGAIAVARPADGNAFDDDDGALVADVANRLGIAMEQIGNTELLERLSRTDELTGLLNRRAFTEEVTNRLEHHQRTGRPGAMLYVDMDNFKRVNDRHGHHKGDEAIREVARMLNTESRVGDLTARLGGDEFGIWLEDADIPAATAKAKGLMKNSAQLRRLSADADHPLGLSIGVAVSADDDTVSQLLARADGAMYTVKHGGKGGVHVAAAKSED
ncbi:MAG: sensor domain-containing diguanylate cyclase [Alphaproteobacteria bacterium]|nr:sensor domain-containing diguanylate cyclase [Alphaproteobacteria bacterium]